MHMQAFEVVANALAVLALIALAVVNVYGRRRFEEGGRDEPMRSRHDGSR